MRQPTEKEQHMTEAAKQLKNMIQRRLNNRIEALTSLQTTSMDGIPEQIQKMREEESSKIRTVMQEQKDIIEIITMLFPDA